MIAVCSGLPFIFGTIIGTLLVMSSSLLEGAYIQHIFVLVISFTGSLPFILHARCDWY